MWASTSSCPNVHSKEKAYCQGLKLLFQIILGLTWCFFTKMQGTQKKIYTNLLLFSFTVIYHHSIPQIYFVKFWEGPNPLVGRHLSKLEVGLKYLKMNHIRRKHFFSCCCCCFLFAVEHILWICIPLVSLTYLQIYIFMKTSFVSKMEWGVGKNSTLHAPNWILRTLWLMTLNRKKRIKAARQPCLVYSNVAFYSNFQ